MKQEIKWDNVLSPTEMDGIFKVVRPWINDGAEIYINSDYFSQMLLRHLHEGPSYRVISRNIPYVYRRIIEEAKMKKDHLFWMLF
jgi:hypothetical protein